MRWCLSFLLAASLTAADAPRLFYSRSFPGAQPAYVQISLERDGSAVYRESVDDPEEQPVEFRLRSYEVDEIFSLAEKLDHFSRPLESGLDVAFMGEKTLRWEGDGETHEQKFNYSKDQNAMELADRFARITQSLAHFFQLERTVRFDKLGVNRVLLEMQVTIDDGRLAAGDLFLPLLDRVVNNESYLNMARERAASIAEYIRGAGADGP